MQPAARLLCRAVCFAVLFGAVTYGDLPDLSLEQGQDSVGLSRRMYVCSLWLRRHHVADREWEELTGKGLQAASPLPLRRSWLKATMCVTGVRIMAQGKTEARSGNAGGWSNTKHAALDVGEGDDERRSNWKHLRISPRSHEGILHD